MTRKPMVIVAEEGLREYCAQLGRETRTEYKYLINASHELRAALAPHSRLKALLVSAHLTIAAMVVRAAMGHAIDCYGQFIKQFGEDLIEAEEQAAKASRRSARKAVGGGRSTSAMTFPGARSAAPSGGIKFGGRS